MSQHATNPQKPASPQNPLPGSAAPVHADQLHAASDFPRAAAAGDDGSDGAAPESDGASADGSANDPPDEDGAIVVRSRSGRILTVELTGARDGVPVFLLHGTPGSRRGPKPRTSELYRIGVKMISYDRPGYGGSQRQSGRTVADAACDIEDIANFLGVSRFAVVGRSGGGPHALACAALLPERVTRAAVMVGLAPPNIPELDWFEGMSDDNVSEYTAAEQDPAVLVQLVSEKAARTRADPEYLLETLVKDMSLTDRRIVGDYGVRGSITSSYAEALRSGNSGWIDDALAFRGNWGFRFEDVKCPVKLWHGAADRFSPPRHTTWLASKIPHADLEVRWGEGHFSAIKVLPRLLPWLINWPRSDADGNAPLAQ